MAGKKQGASKASSEVDALLSRYRKMRDFDTTAEPRGASKDATPAQGLPFVIQKHAATRLHYDFRLGWRGVLKSWAVTKGPSYFPGDKRLAVEVEDHPIEYGGFEGTIPKGQYGGGTVMVWDHGTWEPHVDVDEGLKNGSLKFSMHGEKMHGKWALVRMGGRAAHESKPNWLLIKEHDEFERSADDPAITEEAPDSVVTKRDLDQIAAAEDHVWHSNRGNDEDPMEVRHGPTPESSPARKSARKSAGTSPLAKELEKRLSSLPAEALKDFVDPQLAIQSQEPPEGDEWLHELKLDGYRIQAHIEGAAGKRKVKLFTRKGLDWTHRMQALAGQLAELPVQSALLDGEVVVLTSGGGTSFADLQAAFQEGKASRLTYFAFDLLHLNGHDLRGLGLEDRKELLHTLVGTGSDAVRYSEHLRADGAATFRNACKLGAEGIVSKLATGKYLSGRGHGWLKIKCIKQQEFVIGGYTPPKKGGSGIGALSLGYYRGGKLIYAGRTGTGFSRATQKMLVGKLEKLHRSKMPFADVPREMQKAVQWVEPELVGEVTFATWTADNLVRQAAFKGLREDKPAREVRREEALSVEEAEQASSPEISRSSARNPMQPAAKAGPASRGKKEGEVAGIRLTHPEKVLDKESGMTKRHLAEYYQAVSEAMLPHIQGRPLSLVRCPDGSGKPCFFQKHVSPGMPHGLQGTTVPSRKGKAAEEYVTITATQGIVGLAQMGVLEVHPWGSKNDALETPDRIIFDLDPDPEIDWSVLAETAVTIRKLLKHLGLESFVKTTGGKGLHVVVPFRPRHSWADIKDFTRAIAQTLEQAHPELYLIKMTKSARKGKIFIDYMRNDREATAVAPYSPRARAGAGVAMPLSWSELKQDMRGKYSVMNFSEWKQRLKRDPWAKLLEVKQDISAEALQAAGVDTKR